MIRIPLTPDSLEVIRTVDQRLMSYNVEMTEVTGCPTFPARPFPAPDMKPGSCVFFVL